MQRRCDAQSSPGAYSSAGNESGAARPRTAGQARPDFPKEISNFGMNVPTERGCSIVARPCLRVRQTRSEHPFVLGYFPAKCDVTTRFLLNQSRGPWMCHSRWNGHSKTRIFTGENQRYQRATNERGCPFGTALVSCQRDGTRRDARRGARFAVWPAWPASDAEPAPLLSSPVPAGSPAVAPRSPVGVALGVEHLRPRVLGGIELQHHPLRIRRAGVGGRIELRDVLLR